MLISEQSWTGELVHMRKPLNILAASQARCTSKTFERCQMAGIVSQFGIETRIFRVTSSPIVSAFLANLLTLAEDMLVSCIVHNSKHKIIRFYEIPEKDRRQSAKCGSK